MKKFLPDLIAILAFIILSFAYFFPADIEGRILFQHDTAAGVGAGQESKEYLERTGERTRWTNSIFGGMPTYVSELRLDNVSERGGEGLSPLSPGLCSADFYHDAGILYPLAGIRNIGLAGRIRRSDMGILFLFLHSDTGRAYLEVCDIGLYTTYDCRCRSGLPEEIPVGRNHYGPVHRPSDSVESHSDELLFHVCDPVFCRSLL